MSFTIGSLFDGSGGFPLAAFLCEGTPVWASEVEPYPIAVTKTRFPYMKHLGSVTDIKGNEVEPVDLITFGSPCQDLSVAGKRAGLKHTDNGDEETTRSGLFMEAVRIIKEMREATGGKYPRFALWENVPGAFSSNKGEDFRVVCEELIKVVEPTAVMPAVPQRGWNYEDYYCGDGWSLAYRVLDAQYWGVPQRRRRIYLVLDLGGERAGEVLFECEGVRGYFTEGRTPWQAAPRDAENRAGAANREEDGEGTTGGRGLDAVAFADVAATLRAGAGAPKHEADFVGRLVIQPILDSHILDDQGGQQIGVRTDGKSPTLRVEMHGNIPAVMEAVVFDGANITSPVNASNPQPGGPCHTLSTDSRNLLVEHVYCLQGNCIDRADTAGCNGKGWNEDTSYTLNTIDRPAVAYLASEKDTVGTLMANAGTKLWLGNQEAFSGDYHIIEERETLYIVRRLTPTECARLQGFPDRWATPDKKSELTDEEYEFWLNVRNTHAEINGKAVKSYSKDQILTWHNKLHTDSAEYKLWGNGIALPCALYVMQGIAEVFK